jgi:hypothetical protein
MQDPVVVAESDTLSMEREKMGQNHLACAVRDKNVDLGLLKEA